LGYSSWNYYAITNAPSTLSDWKREKKSNELLSFVVTHSSVAQGNRLITFTETTNPTEIFFIAEEGHGEYAKGTFKVELYEIIDVMKNGQLRYLIYDKNERLTSASPAKYGIAGKPAMCMWCHESHFQSLFSKNEPVKESISEVDFLAKVRKFEKILEHYRSTLNSDLDFTNKHDHTKAELMYLSYMEPTAMRLSGEWSLSQDSVTKKLKHLKTHEHEEFPFLGNLYHRNQVEKHAPIKSMDMPYSIREPNNHEPNYFKQ
jgi:hypothetical protein